MLAALLPTAALAGIALSFVLPQRFVGTTTITVPKTRPPSIPADSRSILAGDVYNAFGLGGKASLYAGLLGSATIGDRLVNQFDLTRAYGVHWHEEARIELAERSLIDGARSDGLIRISVTDADPRRAAGLANGYVSELRALLQRVAVSEARQREAYFSSLVSRTRTQLDESRIQLDAVRLDAGVAKTSAMQAASAYAQAQARLVVAQAGLEAMRFSHAAASPEIIGQSALVEVLKRQVGQLAAQSRGPDADGGYVSRYREFAYQEAILALLQRQYDAAAMDVINDGPPIGTIDVATAPQHAAWPSRPEFVLGVVLAAEFGALIVLLGGHAWRLRASHVAD